MRDINIVIDSQTHKVQFPDNFLGLNAENLQGNINFTFKNGFVGGIARLELAYDSQQGYIPNLEQVGESYTLPILSSLLTTDEIVMQLVIDQTDLTTYKLTTDTQINHQKTYYTRSGVEGEYVYTIVEHPNVADINTYYEAQIPIFKTEIFLMTVGESINAVGIIPDEYPSWIDTLNSLVGQVNAKIIEMNQALVEVDNLDITATKEGTTVTITITRKDGSQQVVELEDGKDGVGIKSITKTGTSGLVDTYTITYTDDSTSTFQVTNGRGIVSIEKTDTNVLTDTYTITYNDNTTSTFTVVNGNSVDNISKISTSGLIDTYRISYTNGTYYDYQVNNGNGIDKIEKTGTVDNVDTYTIYYTNGTTTTYTVTNSTVTNQEFEELQDRVEYLGKYSNALIKNTNTGTSLTINDTANCPMPMVLSPSELSQADTPTPENPQTIHTIRGGNIIKVVGKNLFDLDNSNWVGSGSPNMQKMANGIKFNAISGSGLQYSYDNNGKYSSGTYSYSHIGSTNHSRFFIRIRKLDDSGWLTSNDVSIPGMSYISVYNGWYFSPASKNLSITFTIPECLYWNLGVGYDSEVSVPQTITNMQLEKNNEVTNYTSYESQTLPLDLPVENLFDKDNANILNAYISDTAISGQDNNARLIIIPVEPNTTYTISKSNRGFASAYLWQERIAEFTNEPNFLTSFIIKYNNVGMSYTFKTSNTTHYIAYGVAYGNYVYNLQDYLDTIQLEENPIASAYTPYGTTPLEYCKIGNYEDEFYKATESDTGLTAGKWYLKKNIGKVIYNGTESGWTDSGDNAYIKINDSLGHNSLSYSNYFIYTDTTNDTWGYMKFGNTNQNLIFYKALSTNTDMTGWKNWLESHNIIIYYPLATPTYTLLNDTLQTELDNIYNWLLSYQDQTNISQTNADLPIIITATTVYDLNKLLTRVETLESEV